MNYSHIRRLIREGKIIVSSEAAGELENEMDEAAKEVEEATGEVDDTKEDNSKPEKSSNESNDDSGFSLDKYADAEEKIEQGDDQEGSPWDVEFDDDDSLTFTDEIEEPENNVESDDDFMSGDEEPDTFGNILDTDVPDYVEPVQKIQTVDVLTQAMDKFDQLMNNIELNAWDELTLKPDKSKRANKIVQNWDYVEDIHKLLNSTLGNYNFEYLDTFNNLFEKLTKQPWQKGLSVYDRKNYGKPFVTEGLYLLIYELSIDWACFLGKFFLQNPQIDANNFENDSFVKQFPDLILRTYIAYLLSNSEEFDKFMTSKDAFELMGDSNEYNLTMKQVQKKTTMITIAGESLTYYVNLVKNNYADILVGALDKIGSIIYLHKNCRVDFYQRLNIIQELITSAVTRKPIPVDNQSNTPIDTSSTAQLQSLNSVIDNLLLARAEARMLMNSSADNFVISIKNG